jgi:hypothetical protein
MSEKSGYTHEAFSVNKGPVRLDISARAPLTPVASLLDLDYFHLQSTVFQGACFFRALQRNRQLLDSNVNYLVWVR